MRFRGPQALKDRLVNTCAALAVIGSAISMVGKSETRAPGWWLAGVSSRSDGLV
jgi:hypothetical protein